MLETEEAARRLGVKRGTLYAYVSRGLLPSHRSPDGRRSLFDLDDVERLARRARGGRRVETRLATVTTAITQLRDDGPAYRGRPAVGLAGSTSYEEVTDLLWRCGSDPDPGDRWAAPELGAIPDLSTADRLRWAVVMAGAGDPVRSDLRPEAVVRAARRLIASLVEVVRAPADADVEADVALAGAGEVAPLVLESGGIREGSLAGRLAGGLSAGATPELVGAVNAALVLLADHELATSTLAVRVAASTRADLYDAVLAGLGTLGGPLHGGASRLAYSLLVDAERHGPRQALDEALRWQRWLPGFGHIRLPGRRSPGAPCCWNGSPRWPPSPGDGWWRADRPGRRPRHPPPNVDLGLAAVCWAADLPPDAGRTIFTVARVAGWVAHYLEELTERPLRFRARRLRQQRLSRTKRVGTDPASSPTARHGAETATADGRPPTRTALPTGPDGTDTGTSVPSCSATQAVPDPSRATASPTLGRTIGSPVAKVVGATGVNVAPATVHAVPSAPTAMPVGLPVRATVGPAAMVARSIEVSSSSPKSATSASGPAEPASTIATASGSRPTATGGPAAMVARSIGVTVAAPKSATTAVAGRPFPASATARATGWAPTGIGGPGRMVRRSTGVTSSSPKSATSAIPRPPVVPPPSATATASGSSPTLTLAVTRPVAASTTDRVSFPLLATSRRPPGATASAAG